MDIKNGYTLKTKGGEYHIVLKVQENSRTQSGFSGKWSEQSRNEKKGRIFHIWTGLFYRKVSEEDMGKTYEEILGFLNDSIEENFNMINNQ